LVVRGVGAFGAGMTVVIVGAMVRDYYSGRQAAEMFALIGIILMIVPLIAPMVGSQLQELGGWRFIFGFLAAYSFVLFILVFAFLPRPKQTGKIRMDIFGLVAGRFARVLKTRAAMGYLFFQGFSFASMFAFLTESSFVYQKLYHVTPNQYSWVFALNILTMASFNRITAWRLKTGVHPQSILKWGIIVQFAANLTMVLLVWSMGLPPMWALVPCVMFSVGTQGLVGANTQACFMSYFKQESASANGVLGAFQSIIGASVGLLVTRLHNGSALVMAGIESHPIGKKKNKNQRGIPHQISRCSKGLKPFVSVLPCTLATSAKKVYTIWSTKRWTTPSTRLWLATAPTSK